MEILDTEGNKIDLPLEGVENITQLSDRIKELQESANPDWRKTREQIKGQDALIASAKKNLEAQGFELKDNGTIVKKEQKKDDPPAAAKDPEAVYAEKEAQKVEKKRLGLVQKHANGDSNRANVIEDQYNRLKAGKTITDEDEMEKLLNDAVYLANREKNAGGGDPMSRVNTEIPGGGAPVKTTKVEKEKAVNNLKAMGYKFKSKPEELTK